MSYREEIAKQRRLNLLKLLLAEHGFHLTDQVLADVLKTLGFPINNSILQQDLSLLADGSLIKIDRELEAFAKVTLTKAGKEVALGDASADGVATPEPGD